MPFLILLLLAICQAMAFTRGQPAIQRRTRTPLQLLPLTTKEALVNDAFLPSSPVEVTMNDSLPPFVATPLASPLSTPQQEYSHQVLRRREQQKSHSLQTTLQLSKEAFLATHFGTLKRPTIIGHRGALYQQLENTIGSFQACATMGCDAIELDVFRLKDDNLVVFHGGGTDDSPGDLQGYFDQKGNVLDFTYDQVKDLQFVSTNPEFPLPSEIIAQAHIPTLEQVFRELKQQKRRMQVKIELKGPNTVEPTLELVDRLDMVDQCSFSSFDISQLELLRKIKPETNEKGDCVYRTGWLFQEAPEDDFLPRALAVGVSEIHLRYDLCTPTIIQQIHEAGLRSMAWMRGPAGMAEDIETKYWDVGPDESSPLLYATLLQSGVQQLCVNKPEVLIAMFGPRSMKKR